MYCVNCGARMPEGTRFCTKCGTALPVGPDANNEVHAPYEADLPRPAAYRAAPAQQPESSPQTATRVMPRVAPAPRPEDTCPQPAAAGEAPGKRRGATAPIVVTVVLAAVVGLGITAALTSGFGLLSRPEPAEDEPVAEVPAAEEEPEEPEEEAPAESTIKLTLENADDREAIGTFISNFTEVGQGLTAQSTYERTDTPDTDTITNMLLYFEYHMNGNANQNVEAITADDPMAQQGYAYRVDVNYLIEYFVKHFDLTVTADQLHYELSSGNKGTVEGDWFYYATPIEYWQSMGVPYVTSLADTGDNRYEVTFDVYMPAEGTQPVNVLLRVYGWPLEDMLDELGCDHTPIYSASATIEAYLNDEGEVAFHLLRMN